MKPIRILVDSFADKGLTNAQMTNGREIIRRLDPERFQVATFCTGEPEAAIANRPNTRLIHLPPHRQTIRILREFATGRFDILFYVKTSPASKWYLQMRGLWGDRRITIATVESRSDLRNEPTVSPEAIRLRERTVHRCDHIFSNSAAVQQSLEREYGLKSEVVATGVDTNFFVPPSTRPMNPKPQVLFAGSLRPFKQPQMVLSAAARFPSADFVIVGEGPMEAELRERVAREKLANVVFAGLVQASNLRGYYQDADIFMFPSSWEGSPKVILEAAACGLPVIARADYCPETVIDGETGYVVKSDEELMSRLTLLLDSAAQRQALGSAGRRLSERFDWNIIVRQWEEIFLRLAANREAGIA